MDFENNNQELDQVQPEEQAPQELPEVEQAAPVQAEPAVEQPREYYNNAGVGRKESPYADSPYVFEPPHTYADRKPARKKKEKKQGNRKALKGIVSAVLIIALVGGSCLATAFAVNNYWADKTGRMEAELEQKIGELMDRIERTEKDNAPTVIIGDSVSSTGGMTPSQVYAMNVNSVVAISNRGVTTNIYGQQTQTAASGSGFIISEDGYVVTNYHVVEGAQKLTVITYDGNEYVAALVGYDQSNDVALLKVEATGLDPVVLGSSEDLIVGDQVVAVGNPLGELTSTLTVGYISAKDRTINTDGTYNINMMQTDAAINSGNSGGPLFNMKGEVIGITTAKYSGSSGSGASIEGIGFAIPVDDVKGILVDLREYGYVKGAYLGVSVISMDPAVAEAYGLPAGSKVSLVESGSCAEKAGVQVGDIIIGMGGQEVSGNSDLLSVLRKFSPGDTTTITVFRAGQELELSITLDEKPAPQQEQPQPTEPTAPSAPSGAEGTPGSSDPWGGSDFFDDFFDDFFGWP